MGWTRHTAVPSKTDRSIKGGEIQRKTRLWSEVATAVSTPCKS